MVGWMIGWVNGVLMNGHKHVSTPVKEPSCQGSRPFS